MERIIKLIILIILIFKDDMFRIYLLSGTTFMLASLGMFMINLDLLQIVDTQDPHVKLDSYKMTILLGIMILKLSTSFSTLFIGLLFLSRAGYYNGEFYRKVSEFISAGAGIALGTFLAMSSVEFVKLIMQYSGNSYDKLVKLVRTLVPFYIFVIIGIALLYIPAFISFWISDPTKKPNLIVIVFLLLLFSSIGILGWLGLKAISHGLS